MEKTWQTDTGTVTRYPTHYMEAWRTNYPEFFKHRQYDNYNIQVITGRLFIAANSLTSKFKTVAVWYITPKK